MTEPLIPGGYIIISRKIIESEIWDKPPLYVKVWLYLLTKAQHKEFKKLRRGQLRTTIPEIMEACSWYVGYRKETPSKDQIYQIIDWLRKPHEAVNETETSTTMITTTKATHGLLVTIENYDFYHNSKNYESNEEPNNEEGTKATREQRQPNNINKNVKNDKNEKKKQYAEFVALTTTEYEKLLQQFGEIGAKERIEKLSLYKGSTGKKYKSDYMTILNWERKNQPKQEQSVEAVPNIEEKAKKRYQTLLDLREKCLDSPEDLFQIDQQLEGLKKYVAL